MPLRLARNHVEESEGTFFVLVRETEGGDDLGGLRFEHEKLKIKFGSAHFRAIKVGYAFGKTADKLLEPQPGFARDANAG